MPSRKSRISSLDNMHTPQDNTLSVQATRLGHRRMRGYLQSIPNMPLDILHEIFSHLEPIDLLHLTRVAKAFRSFLLGKQTVGIWASARRNVDDLPECPPFLSEPAYAHLMFSPYCHNCLAGNVQNVIFTFNIRYCANCKRQQTVDSYLLGGRGGYNGGMTADMFCKTSNERRRIVYHKVEVESVWHSWLAIPDDDEEARETFRNHHRERVQQIEAHAILCEEWDKARKASRKQHLDEQKKEKLETVVKKLRAAGWGAELDAMQSSNYFELSDHALIRSTKRMTDKAWNTIEPSILSLMKGYKKTRLINERRKELKIRLLWLTGMLKEAFPDLRTTSSDFQPHFVDYALMPEFRQLSESPSSADVTLEDYLLLRDNLVEYTNRWRDQIGDELTSIINSGYRFPPNQDPLRLAMTFFDCTACRRKNMQFPAVIAHECLRVRYWRCREDSDAAYFYEDVVLNAWNCRTWSSRNLAVSRASDRAMKIIQACGLDPMKTSRLTLQELDPRICCKTCSRSGVWLVMSWRTAVDHARTAHGAIDQEEAEWELIRGEPVALAKACEEENRENLFQEYYPQLLFSCARCDDPMANRNTTLPRALDHVRRAHSIANPSAENGDIYISGDTPPILEKPVLLVSDRMRAFDLTATENKYLQESGAICDFGGFQNVDFTIRD